MKKQFVNLNKIICIAGLSMALNGMTAFAGGLATDSGMSVSGSFDAYSSYVWRGFTLDEDAVIQPSVKCSYAGFTVSFWGSYDVENNDVFSSDEMDYVVDYTREFEKIRLSIGHTFYELPEVEAKSREFYLGMTLTQLLFSPNLTVYYDYGEEEDGGGDGYYVVLTLSHSVFLGEYVDLTFGGHYGYNNELFISGKGQDVHLNTGLAIKLYDNCTLSPNIDYAIPLGDLKDENDGNQEKRFYFGFSLGYGF
ncbi:MAG: hypothetical protein JW774_07395 [Candidatus Aureabacteria bacterium]|nr:hypothetical protein [Candidatus Auribacterota bacterium]